MSSPTTDIVFAPVPPVPGARYKGDTYPFVTCKSIPAIERGIASGDITDPKVAWLDLAKRVVGVDLLTGEAWGSIGSDITMPPAPSPETGYKNPNTLTSDELEHIVKDMVAAFNGHMIVGEDWDTREKPMVHPHPLVLLAGVKDVPHTVFRFYLMLLGAKGNWRVAQHTAALDTLSKGPMTASTRTDRVSIESVNDVDKDELADRAVAALRGDDGAPEEDEASDPPPPDQKSAMCSGLMLTNGDKRILCPHPLTYGHRYPTLREWAKIVLTASSTQPESIFALLFNAAPYSVRDGAVSLAGMDQVQGKVVQ